MTIEQCYFRKNGGIECCLCIKTREKKRPPRKEYKHEQNLIYYQNNKERMLIQARAYQLKTKIEVLTKYSEGKLECRMCGESNIRFLGLDHLNGGGKAHKRTIGGAGGYVYLWARKNNYPSIFQVLCHNCNFKKSFDRFPSSLKVRVLEKYSNGTPKCAVCSESDLRTLTLDHINNDGAEDRRKLGVKSSNEFYGLLLRSSLRKDLQVLCHNHNLGKRCLG